eukprot:1187507-Prorocentrum_minimum.AAC.2
MRRFVSEASHWLARTYLGDEAVPVRARVTVGALRLMQSIVRAAHVMHNIYVVRSGGRSRASHWLRY